MLSGKLPTGLISQMASFYLVGLSGVFVNLGVFVFSVSFLETGPYVAGVLAFLVACCSNYVLNVHVTFRREVAGITKPSVIWFWNLLKYYTANLVGLGANLLTLYACIELFGMQLLILWQCLGIVVAGLNNFALSKFLIFRESP